MNEEVKTKKKTTTRTNTTKKKTTKKTTTKKVATPKKTTKQVAETKAVTKTKKVTPKKVSSPKKVATTKEVLEVKETPIKETPKKELKNEKVVIGIMVLIIAIILASIIYITVCDKNNENRIKSQVGTSSSNDLASESYDVVPGTYDYANIEEISYSDWRSKVQNKDNFILLITKNTCSRCASFQSVFSRVLKDNSLNAYKIEVSKLNAEDQKALGDTYDLESTPTTIIVHSGEFVDKIVGYASTNTVTTWLQENYLR